MTSPIRRDRPRALPARVLPIYPLGTRYIHAVILRPRLNPAHLRQAGRR